MSAAVGVFVLFLILALGGGLVLYALVERESESTERMSRSEAENEVRRDR